MTRGTYFDFRICFFIVPASRRSKRPQLPPEDYDTSELPCVKLHHHTCASTGCWNEAASRQQASPVPLRLRRKPQLLRRTRTDGSSPSGIATSTLPTDAARHIREIRAWSTTAATCNTRHHCTLTRLSSTVSDNADNTQMHRDTQFEMEKKTNNLAWKVNSRCQRNENASWRAIKNNLWQNSSSRPSDSFSRWRWKWGRRTRSNSRRYNCNKLQQHSMTNWLKLNTILQTSDQLHSDATVT